MIKFLPARIIATAFLTALTFPTLTHAEVSPVRVKVEASTDKSEDKTGSSQSRTLSIVLSNSSAEQQDLKIKYVVFGRDVSSKEIVAVADGELAASVKPRGTEKVVAPEAKATIVEPKPEKGKPKADATGHKIVGHGAQVLKGETVVAEYYEPASMKEYFSKAKSPTRSRMAK